MKIEIDDSEVMTIFVCALIVSIAFMCKGCTTEVTGLEKQLFIATNTPAMKN